MFLTLLDLLSPGASGARPGAPRAGGTLESLKPQLGDPNRMTIGLASRGDPNPLRDPTPIGPLDLDPKQEGLATVPQSVKCGKPGIPGEAAGGLAPSRGD